MARIISESSNSSSVLPSLAILTCEKSAICISCKESNFTNVLFGNGGSYLEISLLVGSVNFHSFPSTEDAVRIFIYSPFTPTTRYGLSYLGNSPSGKRILPQNAWPVTNDCVISKSPAFRHLRKYCMPHPRKPQRTTPTL